VTENTFTTKSGAELTLQPVGKFALQDILFRIGFSTETTPQEIKVRLDKMSQSAQRETMKAIQQLYNYALAFGVATDPSAQDLDELRQLGLPTSTPPVARMTWLKTIISDQVEAGLLVGQIMSLTLATKEAPAEADEDDE
jgi:hypothetical protein